MIKYVFDNFETFCERSKNTVCFILNYATITICITILLDDGYRSSNFIAL